jgi:hypothetical protein
MYVRFQTVPPTLMFDITLGEYMVDDGKDYWTKQNTNSTGQEGS